MNNEEWLESKQTKDLVKYLEGKRQEAVDGIVASSTSDGELRQYRAIYFICGRLVKIIKELWPLKANPTSTNTGSAF